MPGCAPGSAVTCLLRRQGPVTKEKATPLSVSPSLRFGATCGARRKAGSAQTRLAAQTARGPDPLCAYAPRHGQRGWGAKQRFGPSLRAACASAPQVAPKRSEGDTDRGVAFSLVTGPWRRKRQVAALPGAHPGTRTWQRRAMSPAHRFQQPLNGQFQICHPESTGRQHS